MSWFDTLVVRSLPIVPRFIVKRVAMRYVAGRTRAEALDSVAELESSGACATIDLLGEEVDDRERARANVDEYLALLDAVAARGVDSTISIKLTAFGLDVDEDFCFEQVSRLLECAERHGNTVCIDMEDHERTDVTLALYQRARERFDCVNTVLQAMLYRTPDDIETVQGRGFDPLGGNIRLCKGIYREPHEVAWQSFDDVRQAFLRCLEKLFERGCYVGIATHDDYLVSGAMELIERFGLSREQYEFQMLLGVTPKLRESVIAAGHKLRVYVPYGDDWYAYSLRRLRENPTVARHVIKSMFVRG